MPPIAAMIGSRALRNDESSPTSTLRLISRPIVKKNIAMRASLMNASSVIGSPLWLNTLNDPT